VYSFPNSSIRETKLGPEEEPISFKRRRLKAKKELPCEPISSALHFFLCSWSTREIILEVQEEINSNLAEQSRKNFLFLRISSLSAFVEEKTNPSNFESIFSLNNIAQSISWAKKSISFRRRRSHLIVFILNFPPLKE